MADLAEEKPPAGQTQTESLTVQATWNYISLGVLAVSGILINLIIAGLYDSAALGVFNQTFAVYIMASQFSVGGLQFSVLKYVAQFDRSPARRDNIVTAAVILSLGLSLVVAGLLLAFRFAIGDILDSPGTSEGIFYVALALVFFALNKIFLSFFNGLRLMRLFAAGQMARSLLMVGSVSILAMSDARPGLLASCFLWSEMLLFLVLGAAALKQFRIRFNRVTVLWLLRHFSFGRRAFLSGVFIELNSRVDILMLGFFLSDKVVGIYSFAAMLAEGFYQLLIVARNILNPIIVKMMARGRQAEFVGLVRGARIKIYAAMMVGGLVISGLYVPLISLLGLDPVYIEAWEPLMILLAAIWLASGFVPFEMVLTHSGHPGIQSALSALALITNAALNFVLIPLYGLQGAALATGLAIVLTAVYLVLITRRKLGFWMT